jgi:hypothetical protein
MLRLDFRSIAHQRSMAKRCDTPFTPQQQISAPEEPEKEGREHNPFSALPVRRRGSTAVCLTAVWLILIRLIWCSLAALTAGISVLVLTLDPQNSKYGIYALTCKWLLVGCG